MYLLEVKAVSHSISDATQETCTAPSVCRGHLCSFGYKGQAKKTTPTLRVQLSLPRILVCLFCEQRTKFDPLQQEQSKYHLHFLHYHDPCVSAEHVTKPFRECRSWAPSHLLQLLTKATILHLFSFSSSKY